VSLAVVALPGQSWQDVVLVALNVLQVVGLAWIASRSLRVRQTDGPAPKSRAVHLKGDSEQ
jgi:hypothetical protein